MFTPLHGSTNQELFEKYACNQSSHYAEIQWYRMPQLSSETEVSITLLCQLFLTRYTAIWIKNCLKSTSAIKVETIKIWTISVTQRKPSHATTKLTLFTVRKDEWNTKEDTGKSLKNALDVLRCAKRHISGRSDVKQWKNQAHTVSCYWVMLIWKHQAVSQLLSQSVENSVK